MLQDLSYSDQKRSQNINKNKKLPTWLKALSKIFDSKNNTMLSANDRRTGSKWRRKRSVCHVPKERFTKAGSETPTYARIQTTRTKKAPRKIPASIVLEHILNLDLVYILHFVDTWRLHWWQFQMYLLKLPVLWNCDNF